MSVIPIDPEQGMWSTLGRLFYQNAFWIASLELVYMEYIYGSMQDFSDLIPNALALLESCTKPSLYAFQSRKDSSQGHWLLYNTFYIIHPMNNGLKTMWRCTTENVIL